MHLIGDDVKMQLTSFTDYALRTLLYLAVRSAEGDGLVPIAEVSAAYGISNHHLTKVAKLAGAHGLCFGGAGAGRRVAAGAGGG
jgi:Rrf2 family nitric oxide-sensitive transcriptional repressor